MLRRRVGDVAAREDDREKPHSQKNDEWQTGARDLGDPPQAATGGSLPAHNAEQCEDNQQYDETEHA